MENVPRNCFYVATIHQSENFIPEWETNRLLFRKDGNLLIKFYEYFSNLIPFFLFLNCEYLDSLKIEESKKKESSGFFVDILDIF